MAKNRKGGVPHSEVRNMINRSVNAALTAQTAAVAQAADNFDEAVRHGNALGEWAQTLNVNSVGRDMAAAAAALSKQQGLVTKALKALSAHGERLDTFGVMPPAPAIPAVGPAATLIGKLQAQIESLTAERDALAKQADAMAGDLATLKRQASEGIAPNWLARLAHKGTHSEDELVETAKRAIKWASNGATT